MASYDAIVVGSGFGGAVAAAKLAGAGARVLLLEQGHRWRVPAGASERLASDGDEILNKWNVNDPATGFAKPVGDPDPWGNPTYVLQQNTDLKYIFYRFPGNPTISGGLFEDFDSRYNPYGSRNPVMLTVGRGYGGGSLVYSMIHLRAPHETFQPADNGGVVWPAGYSRPELDPYYDRVETVIPVWQLAYDGGDPRQVSKRASVLADAFARAGLPCDPLRLGLWGDRFAQGPEPPYVNPYGKTVGRCVGCGFCTFGCVFEAKATLPTHYLAMAEASGNLTVATDAEATGLEPGGGLWRVHYEDLRQDLAVTAEARVVIVAAGTVGSPALLLRSRQRGYLPDLSPHTGHHISGNGDSVFGLYFDALPDDFKAELYKGSIMNLVSYAAWLNPPKGIRFVLHDVATLPIGLAKFPVRRPAGGLEPRANDSCNTDPERGEALYWGRTFKEFVKGHYPRDVLAVASVGLDSPDGQVRLNARLEPVVSWNRRLTPGERTYDLIDSAGRVIDRLAAASPYGAERLRSWAFDEHRRYTTVHPVGGCRMSDGGPTGDAGGVVDGRGQVWNYPGLFVIDGSVLPGAVGVSPSHTIAAIAERMSDALVGP